MRVNVPAAMKRRPLDLLTLLSLLLCTAAAGCDCADRAQFQIAPSASIEGAESDRSRAADVVSTAARAVDLTDQTADTVEPAIVVFYRQPLPKDNPRALYVGAHTARGRLVVDTGLWNPGCDSRQRSSFNRLFKELHRGMSQTFGDRLKVVKDPSKMIGLNEETTESGEP
jgi:hypothetical protein